MLEFSRIVSVDKSHMVEKFLAILALARQRECQKLFLDTELLARVRDHRLEPLVDYGIDCCIFGSLFWPIESRG